MVPWRIRTERFRVHGIGFVLAWLSLAACAGSGPEDGLPVDPELLSPPILEAVQWQLRVETAGLAEKPGGEEVRDYFSLRQSLLDPTARAAAADSTWARWDRDPANPLLVDIACLRGRYLGDPERVATRLDSLVAADSTSAVARLASSLRHWNRSAGDKQWMAAATERSDSLRALSRLWIQSRVALAQQGLGQVDQAIRGLVSTLPEAWEVGGATLGACWWRDLSKYTRDAGRLDDALVAAEFAASSARAGADTLQWIRAELARADALSARGERAEAARAYLDAEHLAEQKGHLRWVRDARADRYDMLRARGDHRAAQAVARQSRNLALAMHDTTRAIAHSLEIASDHRFLGQLDSARAWFARADRLNSVDRPMQMDGGIAFARMSYASQLGDYAMVDSIYARNESVLRPTAKASVLLEASALWMEQGLMERAYPALGQVEELLPQLGRDERYDPVLDYHLLSAQFHARQGEFDRARRALERAERRFDQERPPIERWDFQNARGVVAELAGDLQTAAASHGRALEEIEPHGHPAWANRSRVQRGRALAALGRFEDARLTFAEARDAPEYWTRLSSALALGDIELRADRVDLAQGWLERAAAMLRVDAPRDLVAQLRLAQSGLAAARGEARRAYDILGTIPSVTAEGNDTGFSGVLSAFRRPILRDVAELGVGLLVDHPEIVGKGQAPTLALELAERARWRDADSVVPTTEWLGALPDDVVVVAYFVGDRRAFGWIGTRDGWTVRELPDRNRLVDDVRSLQVDTKWPDRAVDPALVARLGASLLGEVERAWSGVRPLYVVAPGMLSGLPWGVLRLPSGRDLIEVGPIVQLAELGPVREGGEAGDARHGAILALGVDDAGDAPRLRHAEEEARHVCELWSGTGCTFLGGENAHWGAIRQLELDRYAAIHVASHARIYQGTMSGPVLRLADEAEGAPITTAEIRSLPLDCDLVFLSCCSGAASGGGPGRGLDSLARAFIASGSRTVLAATNVVDDRASRDFAARFYTNWLGGESQAAALRAAQLEFRDRHESWSHPFYWANYQLHVAGIPRISRPDRTAEANRRG